MVSSYVRLDRKKYDPAGYLQIPREAVLRHLGRDHATLASSFLPSFRLLHLQQKNRNFLPRRAYKKLGNIYSKSYPWQRIVQVTYARHGSRLAEPAGAFNHSMLIVLTCIRFTSSVRGRLYRLLQWPAIPLRSGLVQEHCPLGRAITLQGDLPISLYSYPN